MAPSSHPPPSALAGGLNCGLEKLLPSQPNNPGLPLPSSTRGHILLQAHTPAPSRTRFQRSQNGPERWDRVRVGFPAEEQEARRIAPTNPPTGSPSVCLQLVPSSIGGGIRISVANEEARGGREGCARAFWLPWQQAAASIFPTGWSPLFLEPHSMIPVLLQDRVGVGSWGTART